MQKRKTLKALLAVSAVAAMFCTVGVQAQTSSSAAQSSAVGQTGSMAKLNSGDEKALKDMAQANINEVAAAKIALSKAESSEVKAFAQKMVDDHGAALTKVQAVAQQKGVTLPTEPDAMHKAMATSWKKRAAMHLTRCIWKTPAPKIIRWCCRSCRVTPKISRTRM